VLATDATHGEAASACDPADHLVPYRVLLDTKARVVRLERDEGTPPRAARDALSVDALVERDLPRDRARRRREQVRALLPQLARRMEACEVDGVVGACAAQVQARRVAREWRLDGLDAGCNLSSLGLSVLLATLLQAWLGARARVFVARTRAAVVGVDAGDDDDHPFALFDPTQTARNGFDVVDSTLYHHRADGGAPQHVALLRRGTYIEIWCRTRWCVAQVIAISHATESMTVKYARGGRRESVAARTQLWRLLSPDSDVEAALRVAGEQRAVPAAGAHA
jgi:hypothetical protein